MHHEIRPFLFYETRGGGERRKKKKNRTNFQLQRRIKGKTEPVLSSAYERKSVQRAASFDLSGGRADGWTDGAASSQESLNIKGDGRQR